MASAESARHGTTKAGFPMRRRRPDQCGLERAAESLEISTFRLTETQNGSKTTVNIDGQLRTEGVETTEDACAQALARGHAVCLILHEVTNIDTAGTELLRRLIARGVQVCGSGLYTDHIVKSLHCSPGTAKPRIPRVPMDRK